MTEYFPFFLILIFFIPLVLQSRVLRLRRILTHPVGPAIAGAMMLYFAIVADRSFRRWLSILLVLAAIGLTAKRWRKQKQRTP